MDQLDQTVKARYLFAPDGRRKSRMLNTSDVSDHHLEFETTRAPVLYSKGVIAQTALNLMMRMVVSELKIRLRMMMKRKTKNKGCCLRYDMTLILAARQVMPL